MDSATKCATRTHQWRVMNESRPAGQAIPPIIVFLVLITPHSLFAGSGPSWVQKVESGPTARAEYGLAFDSDRERTVLFGGSSDLTFKAVNRETWKWDGEDWTFIGDSSGPSARCDNAMAFDSIRNQVVSFGGFDSGFFSDTWTWDGTVWEQKLVAGPSARADSFMAFDSGNGVMVLFGGLPTVGSIRDDTWFWNGTAWAQQSPATVPPRRWIQRMAYDSHRGVVVMFGGVGSASVLGDTWEFDGTNWVQKFPATIPPARYGAAIAYDSDRRVVLMFGGQTGFNFGVGVLNDTWEWDGTNWRQLNVTGPGARTFVKMVYDTGRRVMVLFGGYDGTQMINDTWEFGEPPVPAVTTWGLVVLTGFIATAGSFLLLRNVRVRIADQP